MRREDDAIGSIALSLFFASCVALVPYLAAAQVFERVSWDSRDAGITAQAIEEAASRIDWNSTGMSEKVSVVSRKLQQDLDAAMPDLRELISRLQAGEGRDQTRPLFDLLDSRRRRLVSWMMAMPEAAPPGEVLAEANELWNALAVYYRGG